MKLKWSLVKCEKSCGLKYRSTNSMFILIYEFLTVSGASASGVEIARICSGDTYLPSSYLSATNVVTLQFISDVSITRYGFLAAVEASERIFILKYGKVVFKTTIWALTVSFSTVLNVVAER